MNRDWSPILLDEPTLWLEALAGQAVAAGASRGLTLAQVHQVAIDAGIAPFPPENLGESD